MADVGHLAARGSVHCPAPLCPGFRFCCVQFLSLYPGCRQEKTFGSGIRCCRCEHGSLVPFCRLATFGVTRASCLRAVVASVCTFVPSISTCAYVAWVLQGNGDFSPATVQLSVLYTPFSEPRLVAPTASPSVALLSSAAAATASAPHSKTSSPGVVSPPRSGQSSPTNIKGVCVDV